MSILCTNDKGWVISHYDYSKNLYKNVLSLSGRVDLAYNHHLFHIITPMLKDQEAHKFAERFFAEIPPMSTLEKSRKRHHSLILYDNMEEVRIIKNTLEILLEESRKSNYFESTPKKSDYLDNNSLARQFTNTIFSKMKEVSFSEGGNTSIDSQIVDIDKQQYVIPPNSFFLCSNIENFHMKLKDKKFDFILLDPPWWNKFVKRSNRKCRNKGYNMEDANVIGEIPINQLLEDNNALIGVWCTNAPSHIEAVKNTLFPKWGLEYVSTWFWIKVTQCGEPICRFDKPNGKRPYERLIFGCNSHRTLNNPEEYKCIVSVPSAIHSHKPPIIETIGSYLPPSPKCLELFARYLLPGWTSVGNQVLSLQSYSLFSTNLVNNQV